MKHLTFDVIITGGGIAGLWTLATLRQQGYRALLLETSSLGNGQTILSQGIIHGGTKYAVEQLLSPIAKKLKLMPERWLRCLEGDGEINLSKVNCLSRQQYLWLPAQPGNQLIGFLASKAMQSRVNKLSRDYFPALFNTEAFQGDIYALNEPVIDVYSLLCELRAQHQEAILKVDSASTQTIYENKKIKKIITSDHEFTAKAYVFTAGEFNEEVLKQAPFENRKTQRRPLQMLLLKSLPFPIYAHCVDRQFKPRMTITSYPLPEGGYAWYLGGDVAEKGAQMRPEEVFRYGIAELTQLLPWLTIENLQWKTKFIYRAEPAYQHGKIPPGPQLVHQENMYVAWPVKLAYAPLLSELILKKLKSKVSMSLDTSIPVLQKTPEVALPPWMEAHGWN